MKRRDFIQTATVLTAGAAIGGRAATVSAAAPSPFTTTLHKALIVGGGPTKDTLAPLKEAGFGGVEAGITNEKTAAQSRKAAEELGMRIHSVLRGWAQFNSTDAAEVAKSLETTEAALRAAHAYGADAVLLVPCRIGGMAMPRPWEFWVDFDEKTGHIRRVTVGDNAAFRAYIEAHNHATDTSREAVTRLIPLAEKLGVVIALENVWNNLWVTPQLFAHFVASFKSPWVQAYFDIANHVKYSRPEQWILALGALLAKCHVKEFKLNPSDPDGGGSWPQIRDGSVRWPVVRQALERVNYSGWMTIEGGELPPAELSARLDLIIAGK